jgi:hypothetical protein
MGNNNLKLIAAKIEITNEKEYTPANKKEALDDDKKVI